MLANTQVTSAKIRTDLAPEIVHYQNAGVPASALAAPLYLSDTRALTYHTLRGSGLLDPTQPGLIEAKGDLAGAVSGSLSLGRQNADLLTFRWARVEYDAIQVQEMTRQGVDIDDAWVRRFAPQALTMHAYRLGLALGDGGTFSGATGTTLDLSGVDGDVETAVDEATAYFEQRGSYAHAVGGGTIYALMNSKTARALRKQAALADSTNIAGVPQAGDVVVQGYNPRDSFQRYLDAVVSAPAPVVALVDTQHLLSGAPCVPDGIFFLVSRPEGKGSFISTPVFDYSELTGLEPGEISAYSGGTPLGLVHQYEITQGASGMGWYMESTFGLDIYGSTDPQTLNHLGFKIPVTFSS